MKYLKKIFENKKILFFVAINLILMLLPFVLVRNNEEYLPLVRFCVFMFFVIQLVISFFSIKKLGKITFIQPGLESVLIERTQAEEEAFKKMLELKYQFINKVEKYVGAILFSQSFIFLKPFEWLKDTNIFLIEMIFFFGILFAYGFLEQYLTDIKFFEIKAKCKISFEKSLFVFTLDFALTGITLLGAIFIIALILIDFKIF